MLFSSRAPLVIGAVVIAILGWFLKEYSGAPGRLSAPHAGFGGTSTLDGCANCHKGGGFTTGCLSCHGEIASQLSEGRGYHHFLEKHRMLQGKGMECSACHVEHTGEVATLVTERSWGAQVARAFKHPHLDYHLVGKHARVDCEDCHRKKLKSPFALQAFPTQPRERTFLGLGQDCKGCHADIHSGGLTGPCESCHGQESFRPPEFFNHAAHFPLDGGHERIPCAECHRIPPATAEKKPAPFPFDDVRGTTCESCHKEPHFSNFHEKCQECHPRSDPRWTNAIASMSAPRHAWTGFRLEGPHADVQCKNCHQQDLAYPERYRDPSAPGYRRREDNCEGCHRDPHGGQFLARHEQCTDCHGTHGFRPTAMTRETHARLYPLSGGHAAVACSSCHTVDPKLQARRFVSTARECKVCHANPHGGQFRDELARGDCDACHSSAIDTFRLRPFDHLARTGFPLVDAHGKADCNHCHVETPPPPGEPPSAVRQYEGTPRECGACHKDVHRGQFRTTGDCNVCHASGWDWKTIQFDHATQSSFPLVGAHAGTACWKCHRPVKLDDDSWVVVYKPLGKECRTCHEVLIRSKP